MQEYSTIPPKPQYWNLTIKLFSVLSRTHAWGSFILTEEYSTAQIIWVIELKELIKICSSVFFGQAITMQSGSLLEINK